MAWIRSALHQGATAESACGSAADLAGGACDFPAVLASHLPSFLSKPTLNHSDPQFLFDMFNLNNDVKENQFKHATKDMYIYIYRDTKFRKRCRELTSIPKILVKLYHSKWSSTWGLRNICPLYPHPMTSPLYPNVWWLRHHRWSLVSLTSSDQTNPRPGKSAI